MMIVQKLFVISLAVVLLGGCDGGGNFRDNDPTSSEVMPNKTASISVEKLREYAAMVRGFKPVDQFDVGPDLDILVGWTFDIEAEPRPTGLSNEICPGTPSWSYNRQDKTLGVTFGKGEALRDYWTGSSLMMGPIGVGDDHLSYTQIYTIDCVVSRGDSYVGTNAFGVSVNVNVRKETFLSLGFLRSIFEGDLNYWIIEGLDPNDARRLSHSIRARVTGRIGKWPSGQPIVCGVNKAIKATIGLPRDEFRHGYFVNAKINRVELIDTVTGKILKIHR